MKNTLYNIREVLAENERRRLAKEAKAPYDPLTGVGCWGDRVEAGGCLVPRAVVERCPEYLSLTPVERDKARIIDDFEFWCARCVIIKDKMKGRNVPFVLNAPQRRLLAVMEQQRVEGRPVRVILLKARQWGGSTLVQMYMAWMQLVRHKGWNSLICGHLQGTSKGIKSMYNLMLRHYPPEMLDDETDVPRFTRLEGQSNVQQITARDCLVVMGSSRSEDAARSFDISMAHLSEVAFWQESAMHSPDDLVRSVCGSIVLKPDTVVVLESTANGVGNYFHDEWLRAGLERSDKEQVFVPWHEIDIYSKPVDNAEALWQEMDDYEHMLWDDGCTLEQINWYHHKRKEHRSHEHMMAEYPSNASEAFSLTGNNPFDRNDLDRLEQNCHVQPLLVGDIQAAGQSGQEAKRGIHLVKAANGLLKVWEMPEVNGPVRTRYIVVVDVGGRAESSDYSVIAVWRMGDRSRLPAVVAQWRGHIDHDRLGWKAMQLAKFYADAVLVVECNTLINEAARAGESEYILQQVYQVYGRVYKSNGKTLGFHTNVKTKNKVITALIEALRDHAYIERDIDAVNEMRDYQEHNGRFAARPGKHDDILMTRAIGLLVMKDKVLNGNVEPPPLDLTHDRWMVEHLR